MLRILILNIWLSEDGLFKCRAEDLNIVCSPGVWIYIRFKIHREHKETNHANWFLTLTKENPLDFTEFKTNQAYHLSDCFVEEHAGESILAEFSVWLQQLVSFFEAPISKKKQAQCPLFAWKLNFV